VLGPAANQVRVRCRGLYSALMSMERAALDFAQGFNGSGIRSHYELTDRHERIPSRKAAL